VEVDLSEGLKSLHLKARRYFSQRTTRALIAFVYEHASNNPERPVLVKSFGTAAMHISALKFFRRRHVPDQNITGVDRHMAPACNQPGIPIYQINIPATAIFNGSPGIPASLRNGCNLDLCEIQEVVESV
jgi:hypothetical protein